MKAVSNNEQLSSLTVKGYKSIVDAKLNFGAINILIGCNGAGKSNLISLFKFIQEMLEGRLQLHVGRQGGPDSILHFGRQVTEQMSFSLRLGETGCYGYQASFEASLDNRLMFSSEDLFENRLGFVPINKGHFESTAKDKSHPGHFLTARIIPAIQRWRVYHFHDTSDSAKIKQVNSVSDNAYLRPDARNLAAFLYYLERCHTKEFNHIVKTIRMVAPFFERFHLSPRQEDPESIELQWFETNHDLPLKAHQLSDGTLRFICLAVVFLQPSHVLFQPETIIVDEPELGLHPYAISVLAGLIRSVSKSKQIIISTQSVELLNEFDAEDVIVVNRKNGKSEFQRLEENSLREWLNDYSLGELWKKNVIGGRPAR